MSLMNEVQIGRYKQLLEQLLSMKGEIAVQQLSPELLPVLVLGDDRPEWSALSGERLAFGGIAQAGVAAERSTIQLMNLPTSTSIVTLERLWVRVATAGEVFMGHLDTLVSGSGAAAGAYGFRDGRFPRGSQASAAQVFSFHDAANPITANLWRGVIGTTSTAINLPVVLTPGRGFAVCCTTVNVAMYVSFMWRERKFETSEL